MTDRELMQMALDTLEKLVNETPTTHVRAGKAQIGGKEVVALWFDDCSDPLQQAIYINATKPEKIKEFLKQVRDRLAQPEQEPVANVSGYCGGHCVVTPINPATVFSVGTAFSYTAPPKREWVGLTDEEIDVAVKSCNTVNTYKYFRAIEAKLKEKNT